MKTIIIGNGIVGLTCALRLAERGGEVVVIGDPAHHGSATLAAGAMLSAYGEIEAGTLASPAGRAKLDVARSASEAWPAFASALGVAMSAGPSYLFDDGGPVFAATVEALAAHGEPHAIVDADSVPGYAPVHRRTRAVRIDREGWIDPRRVMAALERAVTAAPGVTRIAGTAARVLGPDAVELSNRTRVTGSACLIANGASMSALIAASKLPLAVPRVRYGIGATLELRVAVPHTACLRDIGVYSVPYGDHVIVGSTNRIADQPAADPGARAAILAAARAHIDDRFAAADVLREQVGWRPTTDDGYPLIGATSIPGIAIAGGTRRDGFHLAPAIATHIAAVLHGEPGDPRFAPFTPERAVIP